MEDNDSVIFSDKWSTIADVSSLNLNYRRASGISPCTLTGIRAAANSALFVDSTYWKRRQKPKLCKKRKFKAREENKWKREKDCEMKDNIARL